MIECEHRSMIKDVPLDGDVCPECVEVGDRWVHLRVCLICGQAGPLGWEEFSLLPGEANVFFEGTFVGKSYLDPGSIKDTLSISLGRDKRIVVKRDKLKDFSSRKLIGTNQRETYAYEISVRNTKNEPVKIKVEDQVPVSQNSQIEVTVVDVGAASYNKDTGKLTWEMSLQPNETKKVVYKFDVKFPKDRTISGLD